MIHSRPGFAPRRSDAAPAKLNEDMIPALHRKALQESTPLKAGALDLDARSVEAMKRMQAKAAALRVPEILVNPAPSEPPKVLEPGK